MKPAPWIKSRPKDAEKARGEEAEKPRSREDELRRHFDDAGSAIDQRRVTARRLVRAVDQNPHASLKEKAQVFRDVPQYLRDEAIEGVRMDLAARLKDAAKADSLIKGALLLIQSGANLDEAHDFSRLKK